MTTAKQSLGAALMLLLLVAGLAAAGYARWTRPVADADAALAAGEWDRALASYAEAEDRFDRLPAIRQVLAGDYERVVANQLWIDYRQARYDDLIDKAEHAPDGAAPHLWSGLALLAKARAETNVDTQLGWLTRSEEELRRAVEAAPGDWDTKYDFELVTRLAAERRKQPKVPPNLLMQLLRSPAKPGAQPGRPVG